MGIEQQQDQLLRAWLSSGQKATTIAPEALDKPELFDQATSPDFEHDSPNQRLMGAVLHALRTGDWRPAEVLLDAQGQAGHMAFGAKYLNEQLCSDPHTRFWLMAFAVIILAGPALLVDRAISFFADHLALIRLLWTPAGMRTCAPRATQGRRGEDKLIHEEWGHDNGFALSLDPSLRNSLAADHAEDRGAALAFIEAIRPGWADIVTRAASAKPKLVLPIRRWREADGSTALAYTMDQEQNDPMAWVILDSEGQIKSAGYNLSSFKEPARVPGFEPEIIGLPGKDEPPAAGAGKTPPAEPSPAPSPAPAPAGANLEALARAVERLQLAKSDQASQRNVAATIREIAAELGAVSNAVQLFGIGPGQPQAKARDAIVARLRELAG